MGMPDDPVELRLKAEACRKLADMFEEPERKALWIERTTLPSSVRSGAFNQRST